MVVIQRHLGGGLRMSNEGKRERGGGGGGVAFSRVVRGRLVDDGRTALCFCETFISYQ